jgi:importin subunit beta-1
MFKNVLVAKDPLTALALGKRWLSLDPAQREAAKSSIVQALSANVKAAAQVVAAIAAIELPEGKWPELVTGLLENVSSGSAGKAASLQAIGFICEELDPVYLEKDSSLILTAVAQGIAALLLFIFNLGARTEETDESVRTIALNALLNALDFIKPHFENEGLSLHSFNTRYFRREELYHADCL